jgi:putative flippase GtrA
MNPQVLRFLVCGGLAALVNWLARLLLSPLTGFSAAVILAYAVGMLAGFLLYRHIVWPAASRSWRQQVLPFVVVNLAGAAVVLIAALALVQVGSMLAGRSAIVEALAHGAAIAIGAVFNYYGHNRITFSTIKR